MGRYRSPINFIKPALTLAALATVVALTVPRALERSSAGPLSGTRFSGTQPTTQASGELSVALFNIRRGVGIDNVRDADRIAELVRGFDVVGLNEVDSDEAGAPNQAAYLGRKLGLNWLYAPSERRLGKYNTGNAMLTRLPITHWQRVPMNKTEPDGYRNYVIVRSTLNGQPLTIIHTHTDGSEDRDDQLRILFDLFLSTTEPAILMGDFNTQRTHPLMEDLLARPDVCEPLGLLGASDRPDRIDWILTRGLSPTAAGIVYTPGSDHPVVWVRVKR
jgi:endonuclease/exonuclease/phosphatase family metal-dependent hydrolase